MEEKINTRVTEKLAVRVSRAFGRRKKQIRELKMIGRLSLSLFLCLTLSSISLYLYLSHIYLLQHADFLLSQFNMLIDFQCNYMY